MSYAYKMKYTKEALDKAVGAVRKKALTIRQASEEYGVPKSTLSDHTKQPSGSANERRGRRRELSDDDETALVGYLTYMANQGMPASRAIVRSKVVELLQHSGSSKRINMSHGPINKWFRSFLSRHKLSDRLAESMDGGRASMSTESVISDFFDFFEKKLDEFEVRDKPDQGSMPHRKIEGVPESWIFTATDTGFINADIFYQWFMKSFIPHCGKARPVLLVMDNHESHISIKTIQAAMENNIVLVGFPGHTTHILQPLDVKVFGPLKSRVASICNNVGHANACVTIGKSKFPAILLHAIDQTTPASIQRAFAVTGLCPVNRGAIDKSQLIQPTFAAKEPESDKQTAETCPTCGNYTVNPLVAKGIVPDNLGKILLPPPTKPQDEKRKNKKRVERGRVLSTSEILNELQERERQEKEKREAIEKRKKEAEDKKERKAKEQEERRVKREHEKVARVEKRKREVEEKEERKRLREEKLKEKVVKWSTTVDIEAVRASSYVCALCGQCGRVDDEENGIMWYGCDGCDRWYHDMCLSVSELWYVRSSLVEEYEWFCKLCKPCMYEE